MAIMRKKSSKILRKIFPALLACLAAPEAAAEVGVLPGTPLILGSLATCFVRRVDNILADVVASDPIQSGPKVAKNK